MAVVLVGTMDTKGSEYGFVRGRLQERGIECLTIDAGVLGSPTIEVDVTSAEVADAAGSDLGDLRRQGDRGAALAVMSAGARVVVDRLWHQGRCDAGLALGGTGGTSLAVAAFESLPIGVPKAIVSTAASGDTRAYVGITDLVLIPSVVDIAGINQISRQILGNAAAAIAGMVSQPIAANDTPPPPTVAASMFGVTTKCVDSARTQLERLGYEVLVFHMTGTGGMTLESLVRAGRITGVMDITTTELADELVGGVFSAGDQRLLGAAQSGVPQVVSVGALDMVNFGPRETVPEEFSRRNLYAHNTSVTLMRTTQEECAELGRRVATRLSEAVAETVVFLPLAGVSALSVKGGPFYDPEADAALFGAIRSGLRDSHVRVVELEMDINDSRFAESMARTLQTLIAGSEGSSRIPREDS